jgi:hypothetical protein
MGTMPQQRVEVQSQGHGRRLGLGRHGKPLDDVPALRRRDGDDAVGCRRKDSLDEPDRTADGWREIAVQYVPVVGMDDEAAAPARASRVEHQRG